MENYRKPLRLLAGMVVFLLGCTWLALPITGGFAFKAIKGEDPGSLGSWLKFHLIVSGYIAVVGLGLELVNLAFRCHPTLEGESTSGHEEWQVVKAIIGSLKVCLSKAFGRGELPARSVDELRAV
ncbi:hypothetical protein CkaCkLH20_01696 [Colletotrichum karsti]|uniref:Uncharacterized protein n=1 Tax=Colletotrichum karsti TaxID=1095194 RepID=A0A9P6ID73_9PEZI|nr:uncharacterized protein CkaCkLH20_01696 [Colletotrichum karsti]KAF9880654.1 hypothetical protein CkaCkLH20_01696 [Colletotrichum karsti]